MTASIQTAKAHIQSYDPLEKGDLLEKGDSDEGDSDEQLCIYDPHTTITDKYTFLQDFLEILKHFLQNY